MPQADSRASAGTAVALAMGGNTFLPGQSFNIAGHVGTYRGAYAAALQLGALITEHAAFDAGISAGFNKGGEVGARAGFIFGF